MQTDAASVGHPVGTPAAAAHDGRTGLITHGARSFQATGELPKRLEWMREEVEGFRAGLIEDLGGQERVSRAQRGLVDQAVRLQTVVVMLTRNAWTRGVTARNGEPRAVVKSLVTFENALRLTLARLGLRRRAAKPAGESLNDLWDRGAQDGQVGANGDGRDRSHSGAGDHAAAPPRRRRRARSSEHERETGDLG